MLVESRVGDMQGASQSSKPPFDFLFQMLQKFQNCLEERYSTCQQNINTSNTGAPLSVKESPAVSTVNLDKQLQAWRDNPQWTDQPAELKVTLPKGSLCNLDATFQLGLPPDAVFNILTDPENRRVFKNIKEVISRKVVLDEGSRQVVEVEQAAVWRFLWLSGTMTLHLFVDQDRESRTVKFKQGRTGLTERFEGSWKIEPLFVDVELCNATKPRTLDEYNACTGGRGRVASALTFSELIQPSRIMPPPITWYVHGITARSSEMMIDDLLAEAARLRGVGRNGESMEVHSPADKDGSRENGANDIKERWQRRRRCTSRSRICSS